MMDHQCRGYGYITPCSRKPSDIQNLKFGGTEMREDDMVRAQHHLLIAPLNSIGHLGNNLQTLVLLIV